VVCLQETKIAFMNQRIFLSVFGTAYDKYVELPADGTRGGILIAWKSNICQILASRVDNYSISVQFEEHEGRNWWFTGVYGPQDDVDKIAFLQELRDVRALCSGPWLIAGDFNLIYQIMPQPTRSYWLQWSHTSCLDASLFNKWAVWFTRSNDKY